MVFTFLWLILCGFIDKTSEIKRNKQQKSSYSMLYLLCYYLFKLISINLVLYFRMQVSALLLLPPLLAGWHLIVCTQKSSPAHHMVCCSHVQTARTRDLKGACVCTTGLVNHSLLLPWQEIPPFLSYIVSRIKKKGHSVTKSISQNNFKVFLQLCRKQWTEFKCNAESWIFSTGPRRDLWS